MKIQVLLILSIFTLTSCNEKKKNITKLNKQITEFRIDIKAEETKENEYSVNIKTNFPERTSFTIDVKRDYKRKNISDQYAGVLFYAFSTLVKNGEINFIFKVDDLQWINEYKNLQKEWGSSHNTLKDIDFGTIKDTIEISVLYTPMAEKNKENIELIGKNGEFLKGDGVEKNSTFNIFCKTIKVFNKFNKQAK